MQEIILPQIMAIGIYNSDVAVKNRSITKDRTTTMFEIELPIEESGVSYIDSEKMLINRSMIICVKPGQVRHTKLPFKCYYIHMIVHSGALYDTLMSLPNFLLTKKTDVYLDIFCKLCKYHDTYFENDTLILQSLILELVYTLSRDSKKQAYQESMNQAKYERIEKVLQYIKENLTEDLCLNQMAELASLSPVHFHNCFKAVTGETLHHYVEEQRMKKAVDLLLTTNFPLAEIALESGFSSQSYFSYVFKRRMNMTPREYAVEVYKRYDL